MIQLTAFSIKRGLKEFGSTKDTCVDVHSTIECAERSITLSSSAGKGGEAAHHGEDGLLGMPGRIRPVKCTAHTTLVCILS